MQRRPLASRMSRSRIMDIMIKSTLLPATARQACAKMLCRAAPGNAGTGTSANPYHPPCELD